MTGTVGELIERLKRLDPNKKVLSNVYSVEDMREGVAGYLENEGAIAEMTDDEVMEEFCNHYDGNEETSWWDACRGVALSIER